MGRRGSTGRPSSGRSWRTSVQAKTQTRALAALLLAAAGARADELKPYQATYQGIWHGMTVAVSQLQLQRNGDTWTYTSKSEGRGLGKLVSGFSPDQTSVVKVLAGGAIQPQSYRSGGGDAKHSIEL